MYYFNYQFVNRAGVQIEVSFTEFGRPEKVTLDVDDVLNWLRIFRARSPPSFVLKANIKSNDVPIKINGEDIYRMVSSTQRDEVFVIDISVKGMFTLMLSIFHCVNVRYSFYTFLLILFLDYKFKRKSILNYRLT